MSLGQIIRTVLEIVFVVFTLWAVFHEDLFAALEERIAASLKRKKLKVVRGASRTVR